MSGCACIISIASCGNDCKKNLLGYRRGSPNSPIQLIPEDVVSLLDIVQLIAVREFSLLHVCYGFHRKHLRFVWDYDNAERKELLLCVDMPGEKI